MPALYPTDPLDVGCTNKATITTVVDDLAQITTTQTITNTRFRDRIWADGCVVTLRNCIVYGRTGQNILIRSINGGSFVMEDCEAGIGPADSYPEEPDGIADITAPATVAWDATGTVRRTYFHHSGDFIRLRGGNVIEDIYAHNVAGMENGHGDAVQVITTSGELAVVRRSFLVARYDDTLRVPSGFGITGSVLVKADTGPIDNILFHDLYVDSDGAYTFRIDDSGPFGAPTNIEAYNIWVGPNHTSRPMLLDTTIDLSNWHLHTGDNAGELLEGVSSRLDGETAAFDDAVFVWNPGDHQTYSFDEVTAADVLQSDRASFYDGPITTHDDDGTTRKVRIYRGAAAAPFDIVPINPSTDGFTLMGAFKYGDGGTIVSIADNTTSINVASLAVSDSELSFGVRVAGGSPGGTNWPRIGSAWTPDSDPHVLVATSSLSRGVRTVELFLDGVSVGSDTSDMSATFTPNRTTIGRTDDLTPALSSGITILAVAGWDRVLDSGEIAAVTSDPFNTPTEANSVSAFDDDTFDWEPDPAGDGSAASKDLVSDTSAAGVTEGSVISATILGASRKGRRYGNNQASRFALEPVTDTATGATILAVVRSPNGTERVWGFCIQDTSAGTNNYITMRWDADDILRFQYNRLATLVTADWTVSGYTTEAVVVVMTLAQSGANYTATAYVDGTQRATDTQTISDLTSFDRISVGALDRATSPAYSASADVFALNVWDRVLDAGEIAEITANPFDDPTNQFTGTAAPTEADDTAVGAGTFTPPDITGSAAPTESDDTSVASGTFVAPEFTGTAAPTEEDDTAAGAGTFVAPTFEGVGAATEADDTAAGSATFTAPTYSGTAAVLEEDDTATGSGTFVAAPNTFVGSAAPTEEDDTAVGVGTFVGIVPTRPGSGTTTIAGPTGTTMTPMDTVALGTDVVVEGTFRDADGDLATPTARTLTYQAPSGIDQTIPQAQIVVLSTGVLEAVIPTDQVGVWRYRWNVTIGGYDLVVEGSFCVESSFAVAS